MKENEGASAEANVSKHPLRQFGSQADLVEALNLELAKSFQSRANPIANPTKEGLFRMGLSGGSVLPYVRPDLWAASLKDLTDALCIYPIDERYVPLEHPESNAGQMLRRFKELFSIYFDPGGGLGREAIFLKPYPTHLELAEAAKNYEDAAREAWVQGACPDESKQESGHGKTGVAESMSFSDNRGEALSLGFDFLLLGAGPDGHIASLFPGHPLLQERHAWVVYLEDSPKAPPERLSFSLPFLQASRRGILLLTKISSDKAELWKRLSAIFFSSSSSSVLTRKTTDLLPVELLLRGMGERLEVWTLP